MLCKDSVTVAQYSSRPFISASASMTLSSCALLYFTYNGYLKLVKVFDLINNMHTHIITGYLRIVRCHVHCRLRAVLHLLQLCGNCENIEHGFFARTLQLLLVSTEAHRPTENRFVDVDSIAEGH